MEKKWKSIQALTLLLVVTGAFRYGCFLARSPMLVPAKQSAEGDPERVSFFDPDTPCGVVSVALAAKIVGRNVSLEDCRRVVVHDQRGWTTAEQLLEGLEKLGMSGMAFRFSLFPKLATDAAAIVHLNDSHWAVVRSRGSEYLLLDPPHDPQLFRNRAREWNGVAILVCPSDQRLSEIYDAHLK